MCVKLPPGDLNPGPYPSHQVRFSASKFNSVLIELREF